MNIPHVNLTESGTDNPTSSEIKAAGPTAREVLEELFLLLEEYAPTWYTEEHHNRAVAALLRRDL